MEEDLAIVEEIRGHVDSIWRIQENIWKMMIHAHLTNARHHNDDMQYSSCHNHVFL
jgi:predicted transcriptional regulator YdeE